MLILLVFAFLSGLVTIAAPCIWPLLPLVLSASTTGGRKKPLGLTIGLCVSFGLLTLFLTSILHLIPFDPNILRYFAVGVVVLLGISLLVPAFSARLESWISRISGTIGFRSDTKSGFWSGFSTGVVLGIVWAPCAGPILATIATLAATEQVSTEIIFVTVAYMIGIGIPLFFFTLGGKVLFTKSRALSPYLPRIQQVFGIIMLLAAVGIATNYDKVFEAKLLDVLPGYQQFVNGLENTGSVQQELRRLVHQKTASIDEANLLNTDYAAPDFVGISHWINTNTPLSLSSLKGKVVLIDFWTYSCINCIRTLPHITSWYEKYKDKGFIVIGIHTPEFAFEKDSGNVERAVQQFGIHYPVAQDNTYQTWSAFSNEYWPAEYLIDAHGRIRRTHFGEGEYDQTEKAIQALLEEAGQKANMPLDTKPDTTPQRAISPETYFGAERMQYYFPDGSLPVETKTFQLTPQVPLNTFSYGGMWQIASEYASSQKGAVLLYRFSASNVYMVAGPAGGQRSTASVLLDGKPVDIKRAGADVTDGKLQIDSQRLYHLVNLHGTTEEHTLELHFETPATQVFTFTFG